MALTKNASRKRPAKRHRLRWTLLTLLGVLLLALFWFGYTSHPEVTALRNIVHYEVVQALGGPRVRTGEPPGSVSGTVRDEDGDPIPGATVLVASALGDHELFKDEEGAAEKAPAETGEAVEKPAGKKPAKKKPTKKKAAEEPAAGDEKDGEKAEAAPE